jgi:hypothetical protein
LQEHRLNTPAQEGPPPLIQEWSADPSFAGPVEDDDSDSDDDYCSSCSDNEDPDFLPQQQAWAIVRHKKYVHKKQFGRKPYRKGFRRKKSAWALDVKRNLSTDVPDGWDRQKWLARSPCPGCGSRWHRNCEGKGKTFAVMPRKKGQKGQKGSGSNFKGNGGKGTFGTFFITAASMLSTAKSFVCNNVQNFVCQPCLNNVCNTSAAKLAMLDGSESVVNSSFPSQHASYLPAYNSETTVNLYSDVC